MKKEKVLIELPPYYRGLLDMTRTLIHLVRPDNGPPTQSHCVQFLLDSFPVAELLVQAMLDREKYLKQGVLDEPGEPAVPVLTCNDPAKLWQRAIEKLSTVQPAKSQRKRRRSRLG